MILTKEFAEQLKNKTKIKYNYVTDTELKYKEPEIKRIYENGKVKKITLYHCEKRAVFLSRIGDVLSFQCVVCYKQFNIIFKPEG